MILAGALAVSNSGKPAFAQTTDVVLSAGHQGRPASCAAFPGRACNLGTGLGREREAAWTPVVADAAAAVVRAAGLRATRRPADYRELDRARAAVFVHFDGSAPACRSGASVGYPSRSDAAFARAWETRYRAIFPFRFAGENITRNESQYYGFRGVQTPGRTMLVELGELTCPAQERWMKPRLMELGRMLGQFLVSELRS